jgi:hypothetical protein
MSKILRGCFQALSFAVFLAAASAQQANAGLDADRKAAVEAMMTYMFPNAVPVWDTYLYAQAPDGSRTRVSFTDVIQVTNGPIQEFVAGVQDHDAGSSVMSQLERGIAVTTPSHESLISVVKDSQGIFQVNGSAVLETARAFSTVNKIDVDPKDHAGILLSFATQDLNNGTVSELSWNAKLDANLKFVRKRPGGLEIKGVGTNQNYQVFFITETQTGLMIRNAVTGQRGLWACPLICEPTPDQLANAAAQ